MKRLMLSLALVMPFLAGCPKVQRQSGASTEPPVEGKADLSRPTFPIGGYSGDPERDRDAGFTLAGPIYGKEKEAFYERCEAAGLPYAYTVGVHFDFLGRHGERVTAIDADEVRREVTAQVAAAAGRPGLAIWYLIPEELRYWMPAEMEYLKIASEAIREADPLKRPVWMYEPGHRTVAALVKTLPSQQIAGKGVYPNYSGRREQREWVPWTMGQQQQAMDEVNPNATSYAILEMYKRQDESFEPEAIAAWVRHDAYASLAAGAKGIVIFSFGGRAGFRVKESPEWNAYYTAWSGVARELNGPLALGAVALEGVKIPPPEASITHGAPTTAILVDKKQPPVEVSVLSSAAWRWRGVDYWLLVNSSSSPIGLHAAMKGWKPLLPGQPAEEAGGVTLPGLGVAIFQRPSVL